MSARPIDGLPPARALGLSALLLAAACGQEGAAPAEAPHPLEASWLGELRRDPNRFALWVDTGREGWIALHKNDLHGASAKPGPAASLADQQLGTLHEDLRRLSNQAWAGLILTWQAQAGLPQGSALTWFAALAALDAGDQASSRKWLEWCADKGSPEAKEAARALLSADLNTEQLPASNNPLLDRLRRDMSARARKEPLAADASLPAWQEKVSTYERRFYDPLLLGTQALAWRARPTPSADTPPLFSPCLNAQDGRDALPCAQKGLAALGVPLPAEGDDPEAARTLGRTLNAALDSWVAGPLASSSPEAQELVNSLKLIEKLRAQWLEALSRDALAQGRPRQALVFAQLALDLETARDIGPVNAPALFALSAEAWLRSGHTRESLDALEVLSSTLPEAQGVDELVGDLAILSAMNRQGDSKEN